jgi:hypothetical protein
MGDGPPRSSPAGKAATRLTGRAANGHGRAAGTGQYQPALCSCDQAAQGEPYTDWM